MATAISDSGPCLMGPGATKWISIRRIWVQGSVSEGLPERALPDGSPCLHVSVGWFPFPLATCCPVLSTRQSRLSGTNGPASPLLRQRISISNLDPFSYSVPSALVLRAPARVSFRGRVPGAVLSARVPRPSETSPCGGGGF